MMCRNIQLLGFREFRVQDTLICILINPIYIKARDQIAVQLQTGTL